jgi:hypothetical protein
LNARVPIALRKLALKQRLTLNELREIMCPHFMFFMENYLYQKRDV